MPLPPAVETLLAPAAAHPQRAALLFDVDGTLAPIVPRAADAQLLAGVRPLLEAAAERFALVGFVTGRSPEDLDRMVGMPHLPAGMNHGMQLRQGAVIEIAAEAVPFLEAVKQFSAHWSKADSLSGAGISLEDKGPTLSFHYRNAPNQELARDLLENEVLASAIQAGLMAGWGRRVLEVRPPVRVDKGTAARALLSDANVSVAIYFGDDRTDADAWREMREMRREGELAHAACILARSAEVHPDVAELADASVDGAEGVRDALQELLIAAEH